MKFIALLSVQFALFFGLAGLAAADSTTRLFDPPGMQTDLQLDVTDLHVDDGFLIALDSRPEIRRPEQGQHTQHTHHDAIATISLSHQGVRMTRDFRYPIPIAG